MRKRRLSPNRSQAPQRRRNLRRYLTKRHLKLKHREREVRRLQAEPTNSDKDEQNEPPQTP